MTSEIADLVETTATCLEQTAPDTPAWTLARLDISAPGQLHAGGTLRTPATLTLTATTAETGHIEAALRGACERELGRPLQEVRETFLRSNDAWAKVVRLRSERDAAEAELTAAIRTIERSAAAARQAMDEGTDYRQHEAAGRAASIERSIIDGRLSTLAPLIEAAETQASAALRQAIEAKRAGLLADLHAELALHEASLLDALAERMLPVLRHRLLMSALDPQPHRKGDPRYHDLYAQIP